ncbi:NADH-quinone oxidoreductase subunit L [Allocatelliglobosispora scoriae]|uniref:NADH-quinone oxidoreductase subunit L n=1 Tax=Allocatelliglobosispora scoriae TaxID=643052 RepID=A0A841BXF9_9ACTN|nr:NADH-quinone oxidoreductase subunit L [Allocatelliglobosispora scoriae]MBB5871400.1 NADH-quinone oxidoreductase subunit L [Allocatelliglobosispora scoriae]
MSPEVMGWLLVGVPAGLGLIGLLLPRGHRPAAAALGVIGAATALGLVIALLVLGGTVSASRPWISFGDLDVTLGIEVDRRALLVALAVTCVALAVQVYSIGYLHDDERYAPYAAQISLFTAAMLLVVVSGDLIGLLIGWEVMGACSYLLIAHDRGLPEAPRAAVKAFLVTRVGDIGFLLGIVLLAVHAGSFRIADVLDALPGMTSGVVTASALLLLAGVAGKSAQFPLHTWLPDAMAGPTPISALIHAATMVAAGVYVVARLLPVFQSSPAALTVLGVLGAITLLLGALAATAQADIKRVLAWSTVSQLGYMTGALAVGGDDAAIFHLLTHAAFKALLFLGAGCLIHAVGSNLLSQMGGLRKPLPVIFWCMTIGLAALAGVPPLAGFWSKEAILVAAEHGTGGAALIVYVAGLVGTFLTAWYAMRTWLLAFFGERNGPCHGVDRWMLGPVIALAVPAAGLGLGAWLVRDGLVELDGFVAIPLVLIAAGAFAAWRGWRTSGDPATILGSAGPFLASGFRLDDLQQALVVRPVVSLANLVRRADESGVDGLVDGLGTGTLTAGGQLARWHRSGVPRALAGLLSLAAIAAVAFALNGMLR